nr:hypothetical protein Q903MT_gene5235 [Picea sitchensis]
MKSISVQVSAGFESALNKLLMRLSMKQMVQLVLQLV